jgi:hypothetical protein
MVTLANGTAERRAWQIMLKAKAKEAGGRITVGEDKAYDTARKTKHRGLTSVATDFMLNLIAYNLIRIPKLLAA